MIYVGYRHAIDKDNVICMEEDTILSDYLSNCKLNKENHSMELPDPKCHEMPKGFKYTFNRESKERFFSATVDEESYTIIVLDEEGWDSDTSKKRDQKQVCLLQSYRQKNPVVIGFSLTYSWQTMYTVCCGFSLLGTLYIIYCVLLRSIFYIY